MSLSCKKTVSGTKDTLDVVMNLLEALQLSTADRAQLASDLLSGNSTLNVQEDSEATASSTSDLQSESLICSDKSDAVSVDAEGFIDSEGSTTEVSSAWTAARPVVVPPKTVIVDDTDHYAEVEAAISGGSVLTTYKSVYFNFPVDPDPKVQLYYITRGRKIGVFAGWNNVGHNVMGVSRALFAKADTVEQGIEIVKSAIDAGIAVRV